MDHISVPLAQIQASLDVLCRGVLDHEPCDPDEVDAAVSALSHAHSQLGGQTRRSLYEVFASCRPGAEPEALARSIEALAEHLHPKSPIPPTTQLTLFDSPDSSDETPGDAIDPAAGSLTSDQHRRGARPSRSHRRHQS